MPRFLPCVDLMVTVSAHDGVGMLLSDGGDSRSLADPILPKKIRN